MLDAGLESQGHTGCAGMPASAPPFMNDSGDKPATGFSNTAS